MKQVIAKSNEVINLGYQYENEVTQVVFNLASLKKEFGEGVCKLIYLKPDGTNSHIRDNVETLGDKFLWTITREITRIQGDGQVQLTYIVGDSVKKTIIYNTYIDDPLSIIDTKIVIPGESYSLGLLLISLNLSENLDNDSKITIYFEQNNKILFTRDRSSIDIYKDKNLIKLILSETETKKFIPGAFVNIQIECEFAKRYKFTSNVAQLEVGRKLTDFYSPKTTMLNSNNGSSLKSKEVTLDVIFDANPKIIYADYLAIENMVATGELVNTEEEFAVEKTISEGIVKLNFKIPKSSVVWEKIAEED